MKVWITKYALTTGVLICDGELDDAGLSVSVAGFLDRFVKPDWHETEADAIAQVERMADAKSKSLQAQLNKVSRIRQQCGVGKLPMVKVTS